MRGECDVADGGAGLGWPEGEVSGDLVDGGVVLRDGDVGDGVVGDDARVDGLVHDDGKRGDDGVNSGGQHAGAEAVGEGFNVETVDGRVAEGGQDVVAQGVVVAGGGVRRDVVGRCPSADPLLEGRGGGEPRGAHSGYRVCVVEFEDPRDARRSVTLPPAQFRSRCTSLGRRRGSSCARPSYRPSRSGSCATSGGCARCWSRTALVAGSGSRRSSRTRRSSSRARGLGPVRALR